MNITFDDTSPYLKFSEEWRIQPPNDESSKGFWQGTYHAAQSKGARVTVTFSGAGIYLYGSKGPGNAKYSVEIDDRVYYFDAKASSTSYQQLLYGDSIRQGAHTLVLTHEGTGAAVGGDGGWLDVDYIMVTTPLPDGVTTQSNPGSFASTTGPGGAAGLVPSSSITTPGDTDIPVPKSDGSTNQQDNDSPESNPAKIVAIILGVALALVILAVVAFFLYRGLMKKRKAEQAFRYGTVTSSTHAPPPPTMHSRSAGAFSDVGVTPISPTAGPFATPPGSQFAHGPTRSATSSPGPSVLQIGRSVALLETTGDPNAMAYSRAHSSLSHNTAFSASTYGMTPEGSFSRQPGMSSVSFDGLRDAVGSPTTNASNNRQSIQSNGSTVPVGIATASAAPNAWLNHPPEPSSKGKEWKAQGGAGQRQTRTWTTAGGAPSIKTFVQVMDE